MRLMLTKDKIVDIRENSIDAEVLAILLNDHSTGSNILWCTDDYISLGEGYGFHDTIEVDRISGKNDGVIKPRIEKDKAADAGAEKAPQVPQPDAKQRGPKQQGVQTEQQPGAGQTDRGDLQREKAEGGKGVAEQADAAPQKGGGQNEQDRAGMTGHKGDLRGDKV